MYQRIDGVAWHRIWPVGDLHGCLHQLAQALRARRFNPWQDLLISVGDLIDRGPDSAGCLALLDKPWFRAVRGNHEEMALDALEAHDTLLWTMNGGDWLTRLAGQPRREAIERLRRCARLPFIIELHAAGKVQVIAHADYPCSHYAWRQQVDARRTVWSRERLNRHLEGRGGAITGADEFWFGHTPLQEARTFFNQHYIDTGAVFGNKLTLVQLQ